MKQQTFILSILTNLSIMIACSDAASQSRVDCAPPKQYTDSQYRYIISNGIPCHPGQFPNAHNPNTIAPQNYHFRMPLHPDLTGKVLQIGQNDFGVALNGVPFDPNTAEYWNHDRK